MTSLADLSARPEILYLILGYLPTVDLFRLLRTCKALYPTCYRELWSTLVFDGSRYTPNSLRQNRRVARPDVLVKLVKTNSVEGLGFKYTKHLVIGEELLKQGRSRSSMGSDDELADLSESKDIRRSTELNNSLADLLESGELAPRVVSLNLNIPNSGKYHANHEI